VKEYVKKPVTYKALQFDGRSDEQQDELLEILKDTEVRYIGHGRIQFPPPPYKTHGYVENGTVETIWTFEWIVVSSIGEVRVLADEEFQKEFEEA
jgi:hypothetical protein